MSREIKFRAWVETRAFNGEPMGFEYLDLYADNENDFANFPPKNIEQYTGLKDKNGKEIYEGDIVNVIGIGIAQVIDSPSGEWMLYYMREPDEINNGFVSVVPKNKPSGLWKTNTTSHIEVIGTIHENPELLGGEDGQA